MANDSTSPTKNFHLPDFTIHMFIESDMKEALEEVFIKVESS